MEYARWRWNRTFRNRKWKRYCICFSDANVEVILTEEEKSVLAIEKLGLTYNAN